MSKHLITFTGKLLTSEQVAIPAARIDLIDPENNQIIDTCITSNSGEYHFDYIEQTNPSFFAGFENRKFLIRATDASGNVLAEIADRVSEPGEICTTNFRIKQERLEDFAPFAVPLERLTGSVLNPQAWDIIEGALEMLSPRGTPEFDRFVQIASCPLPPIVFFDHLLEDSWHILDGNIQAEPRFRHTIDLLYQKIPPAIQDSLAELGQAARSRTRQRHMPSGNIFNNSPALEKLSLEAMLRPENLQLPPEQPCLLPPPRFLPLYGAAIAIAQDERDFAYISEILEYNFRGLDYMQYLLQTASDALTTGNIDGLQGALGFYALDCGPDDGPIPPPFPPVEPINSCFDERVFCGSILRSIPYLQNRILEGCNGYVIESISPIDACPGDTIIITGSNFGIRRGRVVFPISSGSRLEVEADRWSDTEIHVTVPDDAGAGEISLSILDSTIIVCGKSISFFRCGGGETAFLGGRAAISSLMVNGRTDEVWANPNTDAQISWSAANGGAGTRVHLSISDGANVYLDRTDLPDVGILTFRTPATNREQNLRITLIASHPCGDDERILDLLVTVESELTIEGIEVTQATQFYRSSQHLPQGTYQADNTVPLIENKRTLVRVYIDSGLDNFDLGSGMGVVSGVTAVLEGTRDGQSLPGSPIAPLNGPINAGRNVPYLTSRGQWNNSVNFELPDSWRNGSVTLRVILDPNSNLEHRYSKEVAQGIGVRFVSARPLRLVGVMIRYTGWQTIATPPFRQQVNIPAPNFSSLINAANWLRQTYPINDIDFLYAPGNRIISFSGDLTDGSGGGCGDEWGDLMDELRDLASDYDGDDDAVWVGVLPTGWNGAAWGGCGGGASDALGAAIIFANDTGPILAQEVGHAYDRDHAPGCSAGGADGSYPSYGKSSTASIGEFGVDTPLPGSSQWIIKNPNNFTDFMGYCTNKWVSPYTYRGLYNGGISPSSSLPSGNHNHGANAMYPGENKVELHRFSGRIRRTGQVEIKPSFHFQRTGRDTPGKESIYILEMRDVEGRSIETRPIRVSERSNTTHQAVLHFSAMLPFTPRLKELVILQGDEIIYQQVVADELPELTDLELNITEAGNLVISWKAFSEQERLWHKVRYSANGGETWLPAIPLLEEPTAELDLSKFPGGGNCLVEVYSSDGILTGRLRSEPFEVDHKPPRAVIASPESGVSSKQKTYRFIGVGFDENGRPIPKDSLSWFSSKDGNLGSGDMIEQSLSVGVHEIHLIVQDERGVEDQASIEIEVIE